MMEQSRALRALAAALIIVLATLTSTLAVAGALSVTQPSGDVTIAEAQNFPVYVAGNRWDMDDNADIVVAESLNVTAESFGGGIYTGQSVNSDPNLWLTFAGFVSAANGLETGQRFPIDTSLYRHFSVKIRMTNAAGAQPLQVLYFEDETSILNVDFGQSVFFNVNPNTWTILSFDLQTESFPPGPSGSSFVWQDRPLIRGLRLDPTAFSGVTFEIDWVRLTPNPPDNTTATTVNWSGQSGTVDIDAIDAMGTAFRLADNIGGSSTSVDFSPLPPGNYTVRVTDNVTSATAPGMVTINSAPQINLTQPDAAGDIANNYAVVEASNAWDFDSAADADSMFPFNDLSNITFGAGGLIATTTGDDPSVLLNTPVLVDPDLYRMLCYSLEVSGTRDIGTGSVARILWGDNLAGQLTTSEDIIVQEGLNTYCLGDMKNIPVEAGPPNMWATPFQFIRIDPHEFPTSRTINLASVTLSPLDLADPLFNIQWTASDPDDDATIALFVDIDRDSTNGNEVQIATGLSENSTSNFLWTATEVVAGEYEIFARISDSRNTIDRYATGAIEVVPDVGLIFRDGFEN